MTRPRIPAVVSAIAASTAAFLIVRRWGLAGTLTGAAVIPVIYSFVSHWSTEAIDRAVARGRRHVLRRRGVTEDAPASDDRQGGEDVADPRATRTPEDGEPWVPVRAQWSNVTPRRRDYVSEGPGPADGDGGAQDAPRPRTRASGEGAYPPQGDPGRKSRRAGHLPSARALGWTTAASVVILAGVLGIHTLASPGATETPPVRQQVVIESSTTTSTVRPHAAGGSSASATTTVPPAAVTSTTGSTPDPSSTTSSPGPGGAVDPTTTTAATSTTATSSPPTSTTAAQPTTPTP